MFRLSLNFTIATFTLVDLCYYIFDLVGALEKSRINKDIRKRFIRYVIYSSFGN
jgi:hypothetical protein